jgi:hypothetical protein
MEDLNISPEEIQDYTYTVQVEDGETFQVIAENDLDATATARYLVSERRQAKWWPAELLNEFAKDRVRGTILKSRRVEFTITDPDGRVIANTCENVLTPEPPCFDEDGSRNEHRWEWDERRSRYFCVHCGMYNTPEDDWTDEVYSFPVSSPAFIGPSPKKIAQLPSAVQAILEEGIAETVKLFNARRYSRAASRLAEASRAAKQACKPFEEQDPDYEWYARNIVEDLLMDNPLLSLALDEYEEI